jgi:acyl dehydratase
MPQGLGKERNEVHFNTDRLGEWTDDAIFEVTAEDARAYALATNDTNPRLTGGAEAPPIFVVVPALTKVEEAYRAAIPEQAYEGRTGFHGEQDIRIHRPTLPGVVLHSRAAPIAVRSHSTGTTVSVKSETRDADGVLLNEQLWTTYIVGARADADAGEPPPSHAASDRLRGDEPMFVATYHIDDDQTFRYADAARDHTPYHVDDEFARNAGLPGIIVHGLCTMAFASRALVSGVCDDDPRRIKRIAVRFSQLVFPGQDITTLVWPVAGEAGVYAFETRNSDGEPVLKHGLAEVSPE